MKNIHCFFNVLMIATAVAAVFTFGGCNNNPHAERISTSDSLMTVLEDLNTIFTNIDYDKHFANRADIMEGIERVEKIYAANNDTMPREIAMQLSDYRMVWKGYKRMEGEYGQLEQELKYTNNQLQNLRADLEHKALSENMANRFLQEEAKAVAALEVATKSLDTKLKTTEQKYLDQKPVIEQLTDSIANNRN